MATAAHAAVWSYEQAKNVVSDTLDLRRDVLHVWLAAAIQVVVARFFRERLAHVGPLLIVVGLELANEVADFLYHTRGGPPVMGGLWNDIRRDFATTGMTALLLFLAARFIPHWLVGTGTRRR